MYSDGNFYCHVSTYDKIIYWNIVEQCEKVPFIVEFKSHLHLFRLAATWLAKTPEKNIHNLLKIVCIVFYISFVHLQQMTISIWLFSLKTCDLVHKSSLSCSMKETGMLSKWWRCLNRSELSLVTRLILLVSVVGIRTNSGERRVSERVCVQEKNRRRACALKYQRMTHQCLTRVHLPISLSGLSKNCQCVFFTICTLNINFYD